MLTSIIEKLPEIISSIAAFAALWFTYNQYTKNKITDYKIESWKKEESQKNIKKAGDIASRILCINLYLSLLLQK